MSLEKWTSQHCNLNFWTALTHRPRSIPWNLLLYICYISNFTGFWNLTFGIISQLTQLEVNIRISESPLESSSLSDKLLYFEDLIFWKTKWLRSIYKYLIYSNMFLYYPVIFFSILQLEIVAVLVDLGLALVNYLRRKSLYMLRMVWLPNNNLKFKHNGID